MESAVKRCYRYFSQFGKKGMVIKMEEETLAPESPQEKVTRRLGFLINFTYYAALIILAIIAVRCLLLWTLPFILAFLVATLLQRPLKWLVKKTHMSKQCMSVVLVVCIILLLAGLVAYAGWQLFIGISGFVSNEENMQMLEKRDSKHQRQPGKLPAQPLQHIFGRDHQHPDAGPIRYQRQNNGASAGGIRRGGKVDNRQLAHGLDKLPHLDYRLHLPFH